MPAEISPRFPGQEFPPPIKTFDLSCHKYEITITLNQCTKNGAQVLYADLDDHGQGRVYDHGDGTKGLIVKEGEKIIYCLTPSKIWNWGFSVDNNSCPIRFLSPDIAKYYSYNPENLNKDEMWLQCSSAPENIIPPPPHHFNLYMLMQGQGASGPTLLKFDPVMDNPPPRPPVSAPPPTS